MRHINKKQYGLLLTNSYGTGTVQCAANLTNFSRCSNCQGYCVTDAIDIADETLSTSSVQLEHNAHCFTALLPQT